MSSQGVAKSLIITKKTQNMLAHHITGYIAIEKWWEYVKRQKVEKKVDFDDILMSKTTYFVRFWTAWVVFFTIFDGFWAQMGHQKIEKFIKTSESS